MAVALTKYILLLNIGFISSTINIGGIFDGNEHHKITFNYVIESINKNDDSFFNPLIADNPSNPYEAMSSTCSLLASGSMGIVGPVEVENIDAVQSVCDVKEIPHILTKAIYKPLRSSTIINLHPHPPVLSLAYVDIIRALEWKTFTIVYEDVESILRVSDLIKMGTEKSVTVKQLDKNQSGIYRTVFKEIRDSGQKNVVIDCKFENLEQVLLQAQQIGLMTHEYNYFLTNLDAHTIDLTPFQYGETNITGIRLINPERELVMQVSADLYGNNDDDTSAKLQTEAALLIDGVLMFYNALKEVGLSYSVELQCDSSDSWPQGYSLINLMKTNIHYGLSGQIKFDNEGFRSDVELEVFELTETGINKFGIWNSTKGLNITRPTIPNLDEEQEVLHNKTFVVITCLTDPYCMYKETTDHLYGNDRFEGFAIDLIHELSLMEGFNYTFILREDKKNGAKDPKTQKWSGMIGDLIEYRADLAITDLTITEERESAVDFTSPFMNLGISILFRKPMKAPPNFFSFAEPFAIDTWMCLALAYSIVSVSLYIMGRLCPDEWTNPYPCIEEPEFLVNQFSFQNSIWFTIGSLMQQGTEIAPIAISTRMVAGMWWFFVLIMVSSYTANLAAFLTNENAIELFSDIYSLAENSEKYKIRYGAKTNGSTANFFKDSNMPLYQKIHQHMVDHPEDMVVENKDGVNMAEKENYALFMESTSIEYEIQRHCDLMQYGKLLDDKGYGIAMRKNSPYRKRLSTAVLKLQSSGIVANLKRKWWEERRGGGGCEGEAEASAATPLNLKNVEGVFYVTIFGVVAATFTVIIEMLVYVFKIKIKTKITFKEAFKMEMKSYLNFNSSVKPTVASVSSKSGTGSKSKETESPKHSESSNDNQNLKPEPYGFVIPSIKERLTNSA